MVNIIPIEKVTTLVPQIPITLAQAVKKNPAKPCLISRTNSRWSERLRLSFFAGTVGNLALARLTRHAGLDLPKLALTSQ